MANDQYNLPAVVGVDKNALALLGDLANGNMDALGGLSLGGYPTIRLNGTRFVAVEGDNHIPLPVLELPLIFLRAAPNLRKTWYATKYDPNSADDSRAPDCFSDDGIAPHPSVAIKQSANCAACRHNQFGSGTGADGKPSKGKACSDTKQLAIFSPAPRKYGAENDIFGFRIPPASLKNFAGYVKALTNRGVPLSSVVTMVSFDPNYTYPVLQFKFNVALRPEQIQAIVEKAKSDEVEAIINPMIAPPAPPAAVRTPVAEVTPSPEPTAQAPDTSAPAQESAAADFDFGLGGEAPKAPAQAQAAPEASIESSEDSDDDLARALGI